MKGKHIVLRLCLYEEQAAGDEQRWELGGSNLEESCLPGKVVCPRIIEEIRDNMEGGRDVSGERHDEGKGRVRTQGVREGKARMKSLVLRSLRFRTKQVIKVMRDKDKGDKKTDSNKYK